jgi:DNA-binding phage protein
MVLPRLQSPAGAAVMAKVVKLDTAPELVSVEAMRAVISREVRMARMGGAKMKDLAAEADVSPGTLARLASEDTKYPRFGTMVGAMRALGYRIVAERT